MPNRMKNSLSRDLKYNVRGEMGLLLADNSGDMFAAANYFMDTFRETAFPFQLSKKQQ